MQIVMEKCILRDEEMLSINVSGTCQFFFNLRI